MHKNLTDIIILQLLAGMLHYLPQNNCMRIFLVVAFICGFLAPGIAQQNEIDSLLNELKRHTREDTTRMMLLYYVAFDYNEVDPYKGMVFADELIGLAKKKKHARYEGKGYFSKGINSWAIGNYREALNLYKIAENIFEKAGAVKNASNVNNSMAVVYQSLSDYPTALNLYYKNLKVFEKLKDTFMIGLTYGNIGLVYKYLNQNEKAIEYQQMAISIHERAGNKRELADAYNNLGTTYENTGNPAKALEYYQKELAISRPISYRKGLASSFSNMGTAYTSLGKYRQAFQYLQLALPVYKENGNKKNLALVQKSIADVYLNAAADFFSYQKIPVFNRYSFARKYLNSSLQIFTELEDISGQAEVLEQLSAVNEKQGNFKQSLEAHKKYAILKDSILNDKNNQAITRMEMKYAFEKKEDSINVEHDKKALAAAAEIKRQSEIRKSLVWGSFILLSAVMVSFIFYKKRRDAKQKQQEAEFRREVTDTEMKALRAQMNPHFIFNSLNSISDYIAKNDIRSADRYLGKFAKLMRQILENAEQKEVPLAQDLKSLELYMQLEALRMNHKFDYTIIIDDAIDKESTMVPPLILQPFVENSIWHGIAKKEGHGNILIHVKKEGDNMINCIVEDDGIGRRQSPNIKTTFPQQEKTSLGMKITQARIDILNKIKNTKAAVELFDLAQGMRVEVKLPLATNF